jgi:hypothetical protein
VDNGVAICKPCDGPCKKPTFEMETKLVDNGKALEHKVNFQSGLHASSTPKALKEEVQLWLVTSDARLLEEQSV